MNKGFTATTSGRLRPSVAGFTGNLSRVSRNRERVYVCVSCI